MVSLVAFWGIFLNSNIRKIVWIIFGKFNRCWHYFLITSYISRTSRDNPNNNKKSEDSSDRYHSKYTANLSIRQGLTVTCRDVFVFFLEDRLLIIYEGVRRKADFSCLEANVMRLFYNFATGRSFCPRHFDFLEALCLLLVCEKRRKLIHRIDKSWRNGLHAYAWGCYPTSVYKGISDHLHTKTWIYSSHAFFYVGPRFLGELGNVIIMK